MKPTPTQIEAAARAIINAKSPETASDEWWQKNVDHYREMCAEFPAYAKAHSPITDAFRDAEAALSAALSVPAAAVVGEPVAWTTQAQIDKFKVDPGCNAVMWGESLPHHPDIPLYAVPSAPEGWQPALEAYDAGLLNDFGGGDVSWWQDYIRAELARAHDFYAEQWGSAK